MYNSVYWINELCYELDLELRIFSIVISRLGVIPNK